MYKPHRKPWPKSKTSDISTQSPSPLDHTFLLGRARFTAQPLSALSCTAVSQRDIITTRQVGWNIMYSNSVNSFLERHLWGQQHLFALGPAHTYLFLLEKRDFFFLQCGRPSTRIWWKQSPKTHLFKNGHQKHKLSFQKQSPEWRFLKAQASNLHVDKWKAMSNIIC